MISKLTDIIDDRTSSKSKIYKSTIAADQIVDLGFEGIKRIFGLNAKGKTYCKTHRIYNYNGRKLRSAAYGC